MMHHKDPASAHATIVTPNFYHMIIALSYNWSMKIRPTYANHATIKQTMQSKFPKNEPKYMAKKTLIDMYIYRLCCAATIAVLELHCTMCWTSTYVTSVSQTNVHISQSISRHPIANNFHWKQIGSLRGVNIVFDTGLPVWTGCIWKWHAAGGMGAYMLQTGFARFMP